MELPWFLGRRLLLSALTLFGVVVVVFCVVRVLPGDPARLRAGPYATQAEVKQVRDELGLNRPLLVQFKEFLNDTVHLNLGTSIRTRQPVLGEILSRLPATFELSLTALLFAVVGGVGLGMLAATFQGRLPDAIVRGLVVVGTSTPVFWLGILLIVVFYSNLGIAPAPLGRLPLTTSPPPHVTGFYTIDALLAGQMGTFLQAVDNLLLPALALAFIVIAPIANIARASMIDALNSDYVRAALAIGVPRWRVAFTDAFWNALLPVITTIGAVFGYLLGGNVLIEQLFSWPGIGQYSWIALTYKDIEVLQGSIIVYSVIYITLNVLVDIAYSVIDPRVRLAA